MQKYETLMKIAMGIISDEECIKQLIKLDSTLKDNEVVSCVPVEKIAKAFVEYPCMSELALVDSYEELFYKYFRLRPDMGSNTQVNYFEINDTICWSIQKEAQFYEFDKFIGDEIEKTIYVVKD